MHCCRVFFAITLALAVVLGPSPSLADEQKKLKAVQNEIAKSKESLKVNEQKLDNTQKALKASESQIASINKRMRRIQRDLKQQQSALQQLQKDQGKLQAQKREQEKFIAEQINTAYRLGKEKKIKLLLNQEDPAKLSRQIAYADYFNKARLESIQNYQATVNELEELKPRIQQNSANLLRSKEKLVKEKQSLSAQVKTRNRLLAKLSKNISSDKSRIAQLEADQKRLEALIRQVETTVKNIKLPSDSTPFSKMRRKLLWPADGHLDKRFGDKRSNSKVRWEGVGFYAQTGSNVRATHHGQVVFSDWFRGKGFLMIIDHGEGYMSLYAHNESLLRDVGDWVSSGENIATLGNTGGLDHAELYFEIRKNGEPLNPRKWLRKSY